MGRAADQRCDERGQAGRGYHGVTERSGLSRLPRKLVRMPGGVATRTTKRGSLRLPASDLVRRVCIGDLQDPVDVLDVTSLQP